MIKEMGESSRHTKVSAEAERGVIRDVGMETIPLAERCRRYVDNTISLLELWKLQNKIKNQNQGTCIS